MSLGIKVKNLGHAVLLETWLCGVRTLCPKKTNTTVPRAGGA